ncbi:MAG: glycogen/starch synthase [Anaerolineae bacterium]
MPTRKKTRLKVAIPAWEIGRAGSGLGVKIGGLGVVIEELPPELVKAARRQEVNLTVETLTPCFAHYDRECLTGTGLSFPAYVDGHRFDFEVYKHTFPDPGYKRRGQTVVYFWNETLLHWTHAGAIYPDDPLLAANLYAAVAQAMAGYIAQGGFDTVHSHDYHVGLIPFYLGDEYLQKVPHHFTVHNATYQGLVPVHGDGYAALDRLALPGEALYHRYFDYYDHLNMMKAVLLKTHEGLGKVTTVSGDLEGTWGYAAELRQSHHEVYQRALALSAGGHVSEVFVPNRHLDVFEMIPVAGITNGISAANRPENLKELQAGYLQKAQAGRGPGNPLFRNPAVLGAMLAQDHNFDVDHLDTRADLKRLLHLEAFDVEPLLDPILITVVGRLVGQKNLGLVAEIIERTLAYDPGAKFVILASAPDGDSEGKATEARFFHLAQLHPERVYFNNAFNAPLSRLILAGGDFCLIPSRFEPCGLVDYEASLLGNLVIGRLTGGLAKVRAVAFLYEWLDIGDRAGEASAFFATIRQAIDTYRSAPERLLALRRAAMSIDASWGASAAQYVEMYRYGLLAKSWLRRRRTLIDEFSQSLAGDHDLFDRFFRPGQGYLSDLFDWELKKNL